MSSYPPKTYGIATPDIGAPPEPEAYTPPSRIKPSTAIASTGNYGSANELINRVFTEEKVDPRLGRAIAQQESRGNINTRPSVKGAEGLMQVMPATFSQFYPGGDRSNPEHNVRAAARYLGHLIDKYPDVPVEHIAAMYNAGEGSYEKYGKQIPPYRETQDYVKKVGDNLRAAQGQQNQIPSDAGNATSQSNITPLPGQASQETKPGSFSSANKNMEDERIRQTEERRIKGSQPYKPPQAALDELARQFELRKEEKNIPAMQALGKQLADTGQYEYGGEGPTQYVKPKGAYGDADRLAATQWLALEKAKKSGRLDQARLIGADLLNKGFTVEENEAGWPAVKAPQGFRVPPDLQKQIESEIGQNIEAGHLRGRKETTEKVLGKPLARAYETAMDIAGPMGTAVPKIASVPYRLVPGETGRALREESAKKIAQTEADVAREGAPEGSIRKQFGQALGKVGEYMLAGGGAVGAGILDTLESLGSNESVVKSLHRGGSTVAGLFAGTKLGKFLSSNATSETGKFLSHAIGNMTGPELSHFLQTGSLPDGSTLPTDLAFALGFGGKEYLGERAAERAAEAVPAQPGSDRVNLLGKSVYSRPSWAEAHPTEAAMQQNAPARLALPPASTAEIAQPTQQGNAPQFTGGRGPIPGAVGPFQAPEYGAAVQVPTKPAQTEIVNPAAAPDVIRPQSIPQNAEAPPIPETAETIKAQMDSLTAGRKTAVLLTPGTPDVEAPPGFVMLRTKIGRIIYDPRKTNAQTVITKVRDGSFGDLLGYVEPKPAEGAPIATVSAQDANGKELQTAVVSPEAASDQAAQFESQYPNANITFGGQEVAQAVLNQRQEGNQNASTVRGNQGFANQAGNGGENGQNVSGENVQRSQGEGDTASNGQVRAGTNQAEVAQSTAGYRLPGESIESYYQREMAMTAPERRVTFEEFKAKMEPALQHGDVIEPGYTPEPMSAEMKARTEARYQANEPVSMSPEDMAAAGLPSLDTSKIAQPPAPTTQPEAPVESHHSQRQPRAEDGTFVEGKPAPDYTKKNPRIHENTEILTAVKELGGINLKGNPGEMRGIRESAKGRPGLINKDGLGADEMARMLEAHGFGPFRETGTDDLAPSVLDVLDEAAHGKKVYNSAHDWEDEIAADIFAHDQQYAGQPEAKKTQQDLFDAYKKNETLRAAYDKLLTGKPTEADYERFKQESRYTAGLDEALIDSAIQAAENIRGLQESPSGAGNGEAAPRTETANAEEVKAPAAEPPAITTDQADRVKELIKDFKRQRKESGRDLQDIAEDYIKQGNLFGKEAELNPAQVDMLRENTRKGNYGNKGTFSYPEPDSKFSYITSPEVSKALGLGDKANPKEVMQAIAEATGKERFTQVSPAILKEWNDAQGFSDRTNRALDYSLGRGKVEQRNLELGGKESDPDRIKDYRVDLGGMPGEKHIESPQFEAWFGDSKVTDKNGKPLVVYHGTRGNFDVFDINMSGQGKFSAGDPGISGKGVYLTDDPHLASYYPHEQGEGQNILPVYIRMEHPYDKQADTLGVYYGTNKLSPAEITVTLQKHGYDGVISTLGKGKKEYVVFDQSNIKSAIGNTGEFNPSNPSILRSGFDPIQAYKAAVVLGYDIYQAGKSFAAWSRDMVQKLGDKVRPMLSKAWDEVKRFHSEQAGFVGEEGRELTQREKQDQQRLSKLAEKQQKTPQFKQWFSGSKAVDETGSPKIVYHGTMADFEEFSSEKLGSQSGTESALRGFFFAGNPNTAVDYVKDIFGHLDNSRSDVIEYNKAKKEAANFRLAKYRIVKLNEGWQAQVKNRNNDSPFGRSASIEPSSIIINGENIPLTETWVNIPNALSTDKEAAFSSLESMKSTILSDINKRLQLFESGKNPINYYRQQGNIMPVYLSLKNPLVYDYKQQDKQTTFGELMDKAKAEGRDGVIFKNVNDSSVNNLYDDIYTVFHSNQIKSAIGNSGEFNPNNPNILRSHIGPFVNPIEAFHASVSLGKEIYGLTKDFAEWSRAMIAQLGDKVKPLLQKTWNAIKKTGERLHEDERGFTRISADAPVPERGAYMAEGKRIKAEQGKPQPAEGKLFETRKPYDETLTQAESGLKTAAASDARTAKEQASLPDMSHVVNAPKDKGWVEKGVDLGLKGRRAILLSSINTLAKLSSTATQRIGATPVEELIGSALSKIPGISQIASQAPREGRGFSLKAEAEALKGTFSKNTIRQMIQQVRTGASDLDIQFGNKEPDAPEAIELFGRAHSGLKEPAKINEYLRSVSHRTEGAIKELVAGGMNPADAMAEVNKPYQKALIGAKAYLDAKKAILMQDNGMVEAYKDIQRKMESKGTLLKGVAKGLQVLMPIVKVPSNFVIEASSYAGGGIKAAAKINDIGAMKALAQVITGKGLENMTPEQADYIMRNLKKQTLGAAVMAIGFLNPNAVGGYYQEGDEKDKDKVKSGGVRVFGVDVPRFLLHTPLMEMLQIGATVRHVADKEGSKNSDQSTIENIGAGGLAASIGLAKEVPFFDTPIRMAEAVKNWGGAKKLVGATTRSIFIPPDVQNIAKTGIPFTGGVLGDVDANGEPITRKPQGLKEEIMSGIPVARRMIGTGSSKGGFSNSVSGGMSNRIRNTYR